MSTLHKIVSDGEVLLAHLGLARARGARVVLTNGTFDLLHVGHVRVLEAARDLGDILVVALNSDASVKGYKGAGRPVVPQAERAEVLAALACVDFVTFFDEKTADELLLRLRPDVYAKGTDYGEAALPEAKTAAEVGARLAFVGDAKTHAASDLIAKIRGLPETCE